MNTKRFLCAALGAVCYFAFLQAQVRTEQTFEKGWKFTREDNAEFANPGYNDSKWQNVTVPHDWAIYGPFSINNDKQEMAITQDGQTEAMEHAGRTGGLPFVGTGWYRLNFDAPGFEKGKKATLIFDGAMSHARVYINGQEAGYWPYGYNSFYVDATPYLKPGEKNELADIDVEGLRSVVEQIKPAHLRFVISGVTWGDIESVGLTWQYFETNKMTWAEFESKFCVHAKK